MNAKEIIKLCEDEQFDSTQIFSLIYDYFVKRMKSAGVTLKNESYHITATLEVLLSEDSAKVKLVASNYIKDMASTFRGRLYPSPDHDGGSLDVMHPNPVSYKWKKQPLFYVSTVCKSSSKFPQVYSVLLYIVFSNLFTSSVVSKSLNNYPEFSTEEGRKKIFELIDSLVKFIRLTPLGID